MPDYMIYVGHVESPNTRYACTVTARSVEHAMAMVRVEACEPETLRLRGEGWPVQPKGEADGSN